jgi:hypothetical protein
MSTMHGYFCGNKFCACIPSDLYMLVVDFFSFWATQTHSTLPPVLPVSMNYLTQIVRTLRYAYVEKHGVTMHVPAVSATCQKTLL